MFTITRLQRAYSRNAKAADHSLASPLFTNSKAIKATPPLAGGRKVALRFIATRHLLRYRSACGVRHRDIFSDPTMPKAGERERERESIFATELIYCQRIGKAYRSALTFESSLHCRHPDDVDACTHDTGGEGVVAMEGEDMIGDPRQNFQREAISYVLLKGYSLRD